MSINHVFILGAGRSGTKILRDCLGSASDVASIPYDIGYIWRYGNEHILHDELVVDQLTERQRRSIRTTLSKLSKKAADGQKFNVVLEKSVPNTLRPAFVKGVFPDAKLIHVVRDGRRVIESSMRNWQKPSDTGYFLDKLRYFPLQNLPYAIWYLKNKLLKNSSNNMRLWGPRYDGMQQDANTLDLIEVCSLQWEKCVGICDRQLADMPSADIYQVKYEDFVQDVSVVTDLCEFANISDVESVERYFHKHVRKDVNHQNLSDEQLAVINRIAGNSLARHNYE